ncbi:zinc ribbon domain-containing protein, partial [Bifidobacterium longum]
IDRWYPSSKTCSNCGTVKAKLSLSERVYHCGKCGLSIDRDVNAAINIQVAGSAPETLNARGGSGRQTRLECGTMRHPAKREPSGGDSRVRLGAGLGNEAMQMTSL